MKSDLISEQLLSDEIYIESSDLKLDINSILLSKLKGKLEGKNITSGYVMKDSIVLINRSKYGKCMGNNKILYDISYKTKLVSPVIGLEIECYINSITKAGVVAFIKLDDYGNYEGNKFEDSPLLILIPLNRFDGKSIQENTKINIEITALRIIGDHSTIQVIGRPI